MPTPQPLAADDLPPDLKPLATFAANSFFEKGEWPQVREILRQGFGEIAEVEQRIQRLILFVNGMSVGITPAMDLKVAMDIAVLAQLDLPKAQQFALDYVEFVKICAEQYHQPKADLTLSSIELLTKFLRASQSNERQGWVNTFVRLLHAFLQSGVERPAIWCGLSATNSYEWNMQIGDEVCYFLSIRTLREYLAEKEKRLNQNRSHTVENMMSTAQTKSKEPVKRIFLVHGHDLDRRNHVRLAISNMGYEPVVLSEEAYAGRHTLTKFREEADKTQYAVILVTGDDLAVAKREIDATTTQRSVPRSKLRARARQNVIFEWGYFIFKFGTAGVCALVEPNVEILSDLDGLGRVYLTPGWEDRLKAEIEKANKDESD